MVTGSTTLDDVIGAFANLQAAIIEETKAGAAANEAVETFKEHLRTRGLTDDEIARITQWTRTERRRLKQRQE